MEKVFVVSYLGNTTDEPFVENQIFEKEDDALSYLQEQKEEILDCFGDFLTLRKDTPNNIRVEDEDGADFIEVILREHFIK